MRTDGAVLCLRSTVWAGLPAYGELVITDGRGLVLFVHGLWVHPDAWGHWIDEFDRSGYDSITSGARSPMPSAPRSLSSCSGVAFYCLDWLTSQDR
jgi:hypothetical protein